MSVAWTEEQQKVIEVRGKNVLVSAAAGSGKTAVLVERILSMVCGDLPGETPVDVDRLLVVTFTNAAAAEMRERVGLALEKRLEADPENEHLQKQQTLIHNAQITTIHSFCQYVIRSYFHQLDLDPSFRIGDEGELKLLKGDVIKELLEERYAEKSEAFLEFVESYATGKSDKLLEELILDIYEFSVSYPYPERWLRDCMEAYRAGNFAEAEASGWFAFLLSYAGGILEDAKDRLERAEAVCRTLGGPYMYEEALRSDREQTEALCACKTYGEYRRHLENLTFARLSAKRDKDVEEEKKTQVKSLRESVKKALKNLKETYFACEEEAVLEQLQKAAPAAEELLGLTAAFAERYREKKRGKNLADFSDLEHLALEILVEDVREEGGLQILPTEAARELSEHYVQIMIDEYQDSNLIQEIILNSVSRREAGEPNVFMVGDVKQSIYRFRLARPELFMEKYSTYPLTDEGEAVRIDLHRNFRSRKEVLEAANDVFACLMRPSVGGILYDEAAALYPGASMPEMEGVNRAELLLADADEAAETEEERELEAHAAAERIRELLACQQVWDKDAGTFRPARHGDIVILLRSLSGWGDVYARVLNGEGIPAHTESRTGYFTAVEVQTVLNFLRIVDNPRQDIPLAAVLKSMIGGFTDEELAVVRSAYPDKTFHEACFRFCREMGETGRKLERFFLRLKEYRRRAEYLSIHEFLFYMLEDTGYGDYLAAQPAGGQRTANIQMLIQRAVAFENTSYRGLFHFVRYMEQLQSYNEDFGEAGIAGENEDAVRIMTIHKSKGLEFPIVLVGGLGKGFNRQDTRKRVVLHPEMGIGVDYVNTEERFKMATLPKKVLQKALDLEMLGEELRVLYVAFTRAKEKLILLGSASKLEEKLEKCRMEGEKEHLSFLEIASAGTYLDWLLPAIAGREASPFLVKRIVPQAQAEQAVEEQISMELRRERLERALEEPETAETEDEAYREQLAACLGYRYPYEKEIGLRVKLSVSELKRIGQTEEGEEETLLYPPEEIVPYVPRFMQEEARVSGAARGTAYHKALEYLDLTGIRHSDQVKEGLERLVAEGRMSRETAELVRPFDIYAFARTELSERMREAERRGELHTEQPFVIQLPASRIHPAYETDEPVLIQGIVDAWFCENGEVVIVDYKTDYAERAEELLGKYKKQLDYYELALSRLTGKRVKEKVIYSFSLRECIRV